MKRLLLALITTLILSISVASAQDAQVSAAVLTPVTNMWAAWQPFQNGVMMWWQDTDQIWIMNNNGQIVVYPDIYVEGLGNPPANGCQIVPVRGFGMYWSALGGASGTGLGCPLAPELGYDTAGRLVGTNGSIIIDGPGETSYEVNIPTGSNIGVWRVIRIA